MRTVIAKTLGVPFPTVHRVTDLPSLASEWQPDLNFLIRSDSAADTSAILSLQRAGIGNVLPVARSRDALESRLESYVIDEPPFLEIGDVVSIMEGQKHARVLARESDLHHTCFLTNRCNSRCLMCSQPPTTRDDSWLIKEVLDIARHIRKSPLSIGFTGGEPLLLGHHLRELLDTFGLSHPETTINILTNARLFADQSLSAALLTNLRVAPTWMVPLYGHADFVHDFVVQAPGAFDETLNGLLSLQEYGQRIQLRIVAIGPVLEILVELTEFIAKNLPFVRNVAIMGCEPIGYALANRDLCEIDISTWGETLSTAVERLRGARLTPMLMNFPLCVLPPELHQYSYRSISDWKQVYADACEACNVRSMCPGLFASHERGWNPGRLQPIVNGNRA